MKSSVLALQLQIVVALVLRQAAQRSAVAQAHGYRTISRRRLRTWITQRLNNLTQASFAREIREIRPKGAAVSSQHVTLNTISRSGEKPRTRRDVAIGRMVGSRISQDPNVSDQCIQVGLWKWKGRHAAIRNSFRDRL